MLSPRVVVSKASSRGPAWHTIGLCITGTRSFATARPLQASSQSTPDNFRDVGKEVEGIKKGVLFRSARLEVAPQNVLDGLSSRYGIRNVIDLRHEEELANDTDPSEIKYAPGVTYHYVDLHGPEYMKHMVRSLSMGSSLQMSLNLLLRRQPAAKQIVVDKVINPGGLLGRAVDELTCCSAEIKRTFDLLADKATYPAVMQCSYGKDRTGLIMLLLLKSLGAPKQQIVADYCASEHGLARLQRELEEVTRKDGRIEEFNRAPEDWALNVMQYVEGPLGGVKRYLDSIGVDEGTRKKISENLSREPLRSLD